MAGEKDELDNFYIALKSNRWDDFRPHLAEKVKELAFREVYVTGRSERDICLRIK